MRFISPSPKATTQTAKVLAKEVLLTNSLVVLGLVGDLGTGKTTFTKGFFKELGARKKITSPTFLILRKIPIKSKRNAYHLDAYRVNKRDLLSLGLKDILKAPNIVVIEWADRIKNVLPKGTIWVEFEHGSKENERHITFNRR